jgi:hypothetical protein
VTVPRGLLTPIADAVERAGGDIHDAETLTQTWVRLAADRSGRVTRMRAEAVAVRCCCVDDGLPADNGRCGRCWGSFRTYSTPNPTPKGGLDEHQPQSCPCRG